MNIQDFINKLIQLPDKEIHRALNSVLKYENIKFSFDMFFDSTPVYVMEFKNPFTNEDEKWLMPLVIKQVIPDFMYENFSTFRREDTKIMTDFLRVFFVRIFILNLLFIIRKNQTLYLSELKKYQHTVSTITNRKNIEYFFKFFFRRKIKVIENIPERYPNSNQFTLGRGTLNAKFKKDNPSIGQEVFTALNRYHVNIEIDFDELKKLEDCVFVLTSNKLMILKSNQNPSDKSKRYYYTMSFVGTKLKDIYATF